MHDISVKNEICGLSACYVRCLCQPHFFGRYIQKGTAIPSNHVLARDQELQICAAIFIALWPNLVPSPKFTCSEVKILHHYLCIRTLQLKLFSSLPFA